MNNSVMCAVGYTVAALTANTTINTAMGGRFYFGIAPEKAVKPFVLIQVYGEPPVTSFQHGPVLAQVDLSVRIVTDGRPASIVTSADLLDTAIRTETPIVRADGRVAACEKIREQFMTEGISGRTLHYVGGVYRVTVT